ncbi:MAG TPA: thioesterase family protein [Thermoanaerobaculia bacterium]|nr:thioesterase family protein [Thermoanaerobaculia bacterium]
MRYVESRARVRYKETDQMGIAHHTNYLVWFEIGRTDLCRATGISYAEIESRGYLLVVTEIQCRYRIPFRYDDEVTIRTRVGRLATRAITFDYELWCGEELRATGMSSHVWVDHVTRMPSRADGEVMGAFREWMGE